MSKFLVIFLQIFMFYIFPLFTGPTDAMGMVFILIIVTLLNSIFVGLLNNKYKWYFPLFVSMLFIPSIFIYYNDSALIHALWYLIVSLIGLSMGSLINLIYVKKIKM